MAGDPVAHLLGQVQARAVALQALHDAKRMLVMAEVTPEALFQAALEHLLADVPERRMAEIAPSPIASTRSSFNRSARATVREIVVTSSVWVRRVR